MNVQATCPDVRPEMVERQMVSSAFRQDAACRLIEDPTRQIKPIEDRSDDGDREVAHLALQTNVSIIHIMLN